MLNSCLMVKLPETKTEIIVVKDFGKSCLNYDEEDYLAEKLESQKRISRLLFIQKKAVKIYTF